jgi:hypothetical protein
MFKNFWAEIDGEKKDIMENGNVSCAFYVSSLLVIFGLIEKIHGTVEGTKEDLEKSGWKKIDQPEEGCVIIWKSSENIGHKHIGFYIGNNQAVSNSSKIGQPVIHNWLFEETEKREAEAMFKHPGL